MLCLNAPSEERGTPFVRSIGSCSAWICGLSFLGGYDFVTSNYLFVTILMKMISLFVDCAIFSKIFTTDIYESLARSYRFISKMDVIFYIFTFKVRYVD